MWQDKSDTHINVKSDNSPEDKIKSFSHFLKKGDGFKNYLIAVRDKITANLVSAKVWFFLLPFIVSTIFFGLIFSKGWYLIDTILQEVLETKEYSTIVQLFQVLLNTFISWCTFTVSLGGTIVVVREHFKISQLNVAGKVGKTNVVTDMDV